MTLEISESEMIERFGENLKLAASRAKEFMTVPEQEKPKLFVEFISGLKVAAGSAHQLAITQENPLFLRIRDKLEAVIEVGQQLPTFTGAQKGIWFSIKTSLEGIAHQGVNMARAKAQTRQQVLTELDVREKSIDPSG